LRNLLFVAITFFLCLPKIQAQTNEDKWVEETYNALSDTQRLGQLFMIRAHSNLGYDHVAEVEELIKKYHIGALCFFQGTPEKQAELTNRYQTLSKVPLMVAMDAEWGLSMRLKETCIVYPKQMMLGAIQDNALIYRFGAVVAKELRRVGVHVNFAPAVDVNNNAKNPAINERSFGENKLNVAAKGFMYMLGMQDNNVMACAKHFPGHGDTDVDSHHELPVISHDMTRLNALELMPFRVLSQYGIGAFMVAHLSVPALDDTPNLPTSLSIKVVKDLLRTKIGFDGIIFTDGLEMKGVTKYFQNGEVSAKALEAGCDMLCLPENTPEAFSMIKKYIAEGKIDTNELARSVKRILKAKYHLGLTTPQSIDLANLRADVNNYESKMLKRELIQNALTLVRAEDSLLPFKNYMPDSMATLSLGSNRLSPFQYTLNNYGLYNQFNLPKEISDSRKREMLDYFSKKKIVIVGLHGMKPYASSDFGLTQSEKEFINELNKVTKVVLVVFGNPYSLKYFDDIPNLICAYDEDRMTQEVAAESLFGVFGFKGKLPISASEKAKCGYGFSTEKMMQKRLEWNLDIPEAVGLNTEILSKIDTIAEELIAARAAPGCQILVAKDGQVVYHKAFGHHTYEKMQEVTTEDLYDLASITKCAATTICLMKLYDDGLLDLNEPMSKYLPILRGSNKENLLIKDVLIHQARLLAWIPFYKNTIDSYVEHGKKHVLPSSKYYAHTQSSDFPIEIAQGLYAKNTLADDMKRQIVTSDLRANSNYFYSDLGMMLLADGIQNITQKPLDIYAKEIFYGPLSISHTLFNPLLKFGEFSIAPTEEDDYFRMQRVRGHVHDMAAAMLGGVSGHAGLFSNAGDLAVLLQMLLNKGAYNGVQFLKPETVAYFTQRHGGSTRRGYGWDMKELDQKKTANMSPNASANTFGHTGFTGNAFYADPDHNLIYVFLSNRTYPDMNNNKLSSGDYRPRIQTVIYEALVK
jgi:beta-N-acetylhexosaminidase